MSPSPSCLRCRFFHLQPDHERSHAFTFDEHGARHDSRQAIGECRAQPPTIRGGEYDSGPSYSQRVWPWVYGADDWCGVFAERGAK